MEKNISARTSPSAAALMGFVGSLSKTANFLYPAIAEKACFLTPKYSTQL